MEQSPMIDRFQIENKFKYFPLAVGSAQVIGLLILTLVAVWTGHCLGGFAWDGSSLQFNLHPLCMVVGMIVLYADAIIVYRVFRTKPKKNVKLLHAFIHVAILSFATVGLVAVFDNHNANHIPNMYSLHSWIGLSTVLLFSLQLVFGFVTFLFPGLAMEYRRFYMPIHVCFGLAIFGMAVVASLTGITEKLSFESLTGPEDQRLLYKFLPPQGVLANCLGVAIVLLAGLVGFVVLNPNYKRLALDDEYRVVFNS